MSCISICVYIFYTLRFSYMLSSVVSYLPFTSSLLSFFFFKQKTAYEMRISDWSSDVCSSDLLFFNTPARRKFLKAEKTEFDHLQEVIKRLALARFDVAFHLRHNGKVVLALHPAAAAAARARRVDSVCGPA